MTRSNIDRSARAGACLLLTSVLGSCSPPENASVSDAPTGAPEAGQAFLLTDVRLLSMTTGEAAASTAILVRDGAIEWIGRGDPPQADDVPTIDGRGAFVMPGLIDMHVHLADRDELDLYLLNGVTTVANLSGTELHLEMRREVGDGERRGPTIHTAGQTIDGDPPRNPRFQPLGEPDRADALIGEQIAAGYDFIKIYDLIEQDAYDAAVAAADARGVPIVGHIPKAFGLEGILAGHDLIAHAEEFFYTFFGNEPDRERIPEAARLVADAGIAVCPNTGFIHAIIQQAEDIDAVLAWPEVRYVPPAALAAWLPEFNRYVGRPAEWLERNRIMYPFLLELTKGLHEAGVSIVVGTDASIPGGVPGFALLKEIESLETAGLSRLDALRAATLNPAGWIEQHLGDAAVPGELAPGKRADLILLDADPREDLQALRGIRAVVAAGTWHETSDLQAVADERAARYAEQRLPYERFKERVEAGEIDAAGELIDDTTAEVLNESLINRLGYYYLYRREDLDTAVGVFRLNAKRHPDSANVWDSLGEAQMAADDFATAIESYSRSIELNPENTHAREQIEAMREQLSER